MDPVYAYPDPKKGYVIVQKCRKCGAVRKNKAATEASVQPDDIDKIIKLTVVDNR